MLQLLELILPNLQYCFCLCTVLVIVNVSHSGSFSCHEGYNQMHVQTVPLSRIHKIEKKCIIHPSLAIALNQCQE